MLGLRKSVIAYHRSPNNLFFYHGYIIGNFFAGTRGMGGIRLGGNVKKLINKCYKY